MRRPQLLRVLGSMKFHHFYGDDLKVEYPTGRGIGASHHTGWTGLVAKLVEQSGE